MMSSLEMDAMKTQMTAIILRDSEGFFDDPKESRLRILRVFAALK